MRQVLSIITVLLLLVCLSQSGCFSARAMDIEAFEKPSELVTTINEYILHPPDEIEIHCEKQPELSFLNGQRQQVRPDGKIYFEDLGEIQAAGKTIAEVTEAIKEKAGGYILTGENPIDVRVVVYNSKVYYVLGEVSNPGPKIFTGRDTVLRAISMANPLVTAWKNQIQIIRPSHNPNIKPKVFKIEYNDMIVHGNLSKNVLLHEGDIIYLPPTILAAVSSVIAEFARPIGQALAPAMQVQRLSYGGTGGIY